MGSSPSSNQKKSNVTLSSSGVPTDVQDAHPSLHTTRNDAFGHSSSHFESHVNVGDEATLDVTGLTDSQQRMVRICLGELETDLEITLDCGKLMNCIKVRI